MDRGVTVLPAPGGGARVVLDDGRRVNVLSRARMEALAAALARLAAGPGRPRYVLLEGNGRGSFAAGADLREIAALDPGAARDLSRLGERVTRLLSRGPWPTGALVDGHALGGGFDLVLACDAVVATDRSRFGHPGLRRGFLTGWGGTARLPRRAATSRASFRSVFLAAEELGARHAEEAGILSGRARGSRSARKIVVAQLQALAGWPPGMLDLWRLARTSVNPAALEPALAAFVDTSRGGC